jgi:circadian clock protein KaiC
MNHSNQLREYRLTDHGIALIEAYVGPDGVLTGAARQVQEARERESAIVRQQTTDRRRREVARKRAALERQIAEMRAEIEAEADEVTKLIEQEDARETAMNSDRRAMAASRGAR